MDYFEVRNLERFQHYSKRMPPWIKWHISCLDNPEFCRLPDASKWLAVGLVMLASRMNNRIPNDPEYVFKRLGLASLPEFQGLVDIGFLRRIRGKRASKTLASRKQNGVSETETETETETPPSPPSVKGGRVRFSSHYTDGFQKAWRMYPHFQQRSHKAASYVVWKRRELEPLSDQVLAWIAETKGTDDWSKDNGAFVPAMEVWLKRPDFTERPRPTRQHPLGLPVVDDVNRVLSPDEYERAVRGER